MGEFFLFVLSLQKRVKWNVHDRNFVCFINYNLYWCESRLGIFLNSLSTISERQSYSLYGSSTIEKDMVLEYCMCFRIKCAVTGVSE